MFMESRIQDPLPRGSLGQFVLGHRGDRCTRVTNDVRRNEQKVYRQHRDPNSLS